MGTPSGSPLLAARLSAGLSQEELAERSGLSVRNISNIERGRVARPRRGSLDALADALSLQPQERTALIEHYRGGRPTAFVPLVNRNFLPRATAGFTGRSSEIATVLELIDGADGVVCSIDGMAGAGKTAFAVHLAHDITSRFPDGQLFVDLRGSTPGERPLEPEAALVLLLRQIGVPGEHIPADPLHRAALWRHETAGLRALVVLDNAADDDQVRSLLPHAGACLILITSRRRLLSVEGAVPISLTSLSPEDSRTLFAQVSGVDPTEPLLADIVDRCAHLPLAIKIAAARLRHRPAWTTRDLLTRLGEQGDSLAELTAGDHSVAAAFAVSYHQLPPNLRRSFRLLGAQPMTTFDTYSASALLDLQPAATDRMLEDLLDMHLLAQSVAGRYHLHDLLRQHARTLAESEQDPEERRAALQRLLDYLLQVAVDACRTIDACHRELDQPITRAARAAPSFESGTAAALTWLETERANLLSAIALAAADGWEPYAWRIANRLRPFYQHGRHLEDWISSHRLALAAARSAADLIGEADMLGGLSWALQQTDRLHEAHELAEAALDVAVRSSDVFGASVARCLLGHVHWRAGRYHQAEHYFIGALMPLSDDASAAERRENAHNLSGLAMTCERSGRYRDALHYNAQALELATALDDRIECAGLHRQIGQINTRQGEHTTAEAHLATSLMLASEMGNGRVEGAALIALGRLYTQSGRPDKAVDVLGAALTKVLSANDRRGQCAALTNLGAALGRLARYEEATERHNDALAVARELGVKDLVAEILNNTADILLMVGEVTESAAHYRQALAQADEIVLRYEQARARQGLAWCWAKTGDAEAATADNRHATTLWADLGVPTPPDPTATP